MQSSQLIIIACLALTLLCGIGAVGLALVALRYGDPHGVVVPVLTAFVTLFGLGASAFFFKGLGG
jgi:hypothetical protein